eukprot:CAMPEP_0119153846 /NCGR_PEP_ID=MMETSP1310-20130426/49907_1 /TAXON_ID=464262 /ORGANISM="Genus nov. species nov., Strain RCC2339" /LENGTH=422 /DNA_ID=CAMNT_0007146327 /DNA_START=31 /DNA_END=1299 /DNA_ORIENTATION=-
MRSLQSTPQTKDGRVLLSRRGGAHTRSLSDLAVYQAPAPGAGVCSFVPSATEMLFALGLGNQVVGVSDFCDFPADVRVTRHIVCRARPEAVKANECLNNEMMLQEIATSDESILEVDVQWLATVQPFLTFTFGTETGMPHEKGAVTRALHRAGLIGDGEPDDAVIEISPYTLSDVFGTLLRIGGAMRAKLAAHHLVEQLRGSLRAVANAVASAKHRPRVLVLAGLSPLVVGGHWLPEMVTLAGGQDLLQEPGDPVERLSWDQVRAYEPEVLLLIPGSVNSEQTDEQVGSLATLPGWWSLPAVNTCRVYLCEHVYFTRPGPRVVQGVQILAHILHPSLVEAMLPPASVLKLTLQNGQRCRPRQLAKYFQPIAGQQSTRQNGVDHGSPNGELNGALNGLHSSPQNGEAWHDKAINYTHSGQHGI